MLLELAAKVFDSIRCPICGADSSYIEPHNDPVAVNAAAAECTDPPVKVVLSLTVQSTLAADIRLFMCKTQIGDPRSACQHELAVTFLTKLPQMIDNAAGYLRAQQAQQQRGSAL
jgi:hypothetical protein